MYFYRSDRKRKITLHSLLGRYALNWQWCFLNNTCLFSAHYWGRGCDDNQNFW